MPGWPGATVVTTLVWFLFFPREAAGAMGARHSPRPLFSLGGSFWHSPGAIGVAECAGVCLHVMARRDGGESCGCLKIWIGAARVTLRRRPCERRDPYPPALVV